jgi:hypothetical protein
VAIPVVPGGRIISANGDPGMALAFRNSTVSAAAKWRYHAAQVALAASIFRLALTLHAGFRPEQPRVPAGSDDGGQWTKVPSWARERAETGRSNLHLVGGRSRGTAGGTYIAGRWQPVTPSQQTRLVLSQMEMEAALRAVREILPNWKPRPQAYSTVEGLIGAHVAQAGEARALREKWRDQGIGLGRFAGESIPARDSSRNFSRQEREAINRIGRETGCQTCGAVNPGTPLGNFVIDHQPPTRLRLGPIKQSLLPHCFGCMVTQGGAVTQILRRR